MLLLLATLAKAAPCASPEACVELGTQLADEDQRLAIRVLRKACKQGAPDGCARWGHLLRQSQFADEQQHGWALEDSACTDGSPIGCLWAAERAQRTDRSRAAELRARACELGHVDTCLEIAGGTKDRREKVDAWERACAYGHAEACRWTGDAAGAGRGDPAADERAFAAYERGCELDDRLACRDAGFAMADGRGTALDPLGAIDRLERACALGHARSCGHAAEALTGWRDVPADPERAILALEAGCELEQGRSCVRLAKRAATGDGMPRDLARAEAALARSGYGRRFIERAGDGPHRDDRLACDLGDADACDRLADTVPAIALPLRHEARRLRTPTRPPTQPATGAVDPDLRACFASAVERLADPALAGREPPNTEGHALAVDEVTRLLAPLDTRAQPLQVPLSRHVHASELRTNGQLREQGFAPLAFSGNGRFDAKVQDAGCKAPEALVRGQVAWFHGCDRDDLYVLSVEAEALGASAVIWTDAGGWGKQRPTVSPFEWWEGALPLSIPVLALEEEAELREVSGTVELADEPGTLQNVIGTLPGRGELASEVVVIGAHYDHLGADDRGALFRGADDNASGVAAMACAIPAVRARLAQLPAHRTVLFVGFDGEEWGTMGSRHFVGENTDELAAMISLDMVGRLGDRALGVSGAASADWEPVLAASAEGIGLGLWDVPEEGLSDHVPFIQAGIPAIHLSTGLHRQYHDIGDVPELVDADGGARVTALASELLVRLATGTRLVPHPSCGGVGTTHLGIGVAWAQDDEPGLLVRCVDEGYGAAIGLRAGDRIVAIDGLPIENPLVLKAWHDQGWPFVVPRVDVMRGSVALSLPPD